jgi:hypothetical protein
MRKIVQIGFSILAFPVGLAIGTCLATRPALSQQTQFRQSDHRGAIFSDRQLSDSDLYLRRGATLADATRILNDILKPPARPPQPPQPPQLPQINSRPQFERKSLAKTSSKATIKSSSSDKFLQVNAENLRTYQYKNGLFEIDIPQAWSPTDNSKSGEAIVLWFDPTVNALISVDIFNAPPGIDNTKMVQLLQGFLKKTFGSRRGFFMEKPIVQPDGSTQIVWGYIETIQGATGRIHGNSFIEQVGDKISLMTVGVLEHQFDRLREPMMRVINSYTVNASVRIP